MASRIDPYIDLGVYVSNVAVGGPGGDRYTFRDEHSFLSLLVVHRDDDFIRGLTMELSNGQTKSVGELVDRNPAILDFNCCQIKDIVVYYRYLESKKIHLVNGIRTDTINGLREVFCQSCTRHQTDKQSLPVGSGWCAGVFGGAGDSLDSIGFAMLKVVP